MMDPDSGRILATKPRTLFCRTPGNPSLKAENRTNPNGARRE
ncbi:hypothetical protein [Arthrobacter sp. DR-2P]|nr:hypothetical protein [Arthrobacter sp. DR-2P]